MPEIFLLASVCAILVIDLFLPPRWRHLTHGLSLMALLVTAAMVLRLGQGLEEPQVTFSGMFVLDRLAVVLKSAALLVTGAVLLYGRDYLRERQLDQGEFYLLTLFSTLGMMVLISAGHFITLYLGLELMSLSLYALVAFNREQSASSEAAMKYFVLGAIASGMLLYGMSILYGVTGSLEIETVASRIMEQPVGSLPLLLGMTFVVAAVAFKLGAVPFHNWLPDVYQGANTPVTLLVGSAPKLAAFAMVMRLLAQGMEGLAGDWRDLLMVMAVLSLALGSVVAIAQTNVKRLLAYSTIGHIGFLLLGVLAANPMGYAAALFYVLIYVLMALGAFGVLILLSQRGVEAETLDDLKGLNARSPWLAAVMALFMFSMAGVPPTAGFYAKLLVLDAVVDQGMGTLAIVAVLFAVISAFYYLRVVWQLYFEAPINGSAVVASADLRWLLIANGGLVLLLGILPDQLIRACLSAF
jgi:NADH-quinone oxidoreductase subunit N